MKRYFLAGGIVLISVALLATSCGGASSNNSGNNISGTIRISGSSTVEPISVRVAELFEDVADIRVNVDGPGTGDGFKLFCAGDTDISDASRAIQDIEAQTCRRNNISYVELQVAIDGIAVMTSTDNSSIDCVSYEDLYALIGPESRGLNRWSDAQQLATELGSSTNLPDQDLEIFGPGEESGTFDSFIELVIEDAAEARGQEATTRPDYNTSADDNLIINGVSRSDAGLGWTGFAFANNVSGIKLLEVDGGEGCVAPTASTIASGDYPVSRPLYIYVNLGNAATNEALRAYVDFYLSPPGLETAVTDVGYVILEPSLQQMMIERWEDR